MSRSTPSFPAAVLLVAVCSAALGATEEGTDATRSLERGAYLVETIGACGNCHLARDERGAPAPERGYSGGMRFEDPHFGIAYAANITPDEDTGIGAWSDDEIGTAIRAGRRPDGSAIGPPMPYEFYRTLSDEDLAAVVAYLRTLPAVAAEVPESSYRVTPAPSHDAAPTAISAPPTGDPVRRGEYLVAFGHCMECHTPRDAATGHPRGDAFGAGGRVFRGPWGESVARNLTPHESGLGGWTDAQIVDAIRTGLDRDGTPYKPPMAYGHYAGIDDADMTAIVTYLRSLDPVPFGGER